MTKSTPIRYIIGIDPGVNTGFALWDRRERVYIQLSCVKIHEAMHTIQSLEPEYLSQTLVRVEDARKRKWFGRSGREKLQGAGSVKRDAVIWEDFLTSLKIPFEMVAPKNNATKLTADRFAIISKWKGRTNEHMRDAGMLCYGY